MCFTSMNKLHNLYYFHHTLDRVQNTVVENRNIPNHVLMHGTIHTVYDLMTVKIRYDYGIYKKQTLADIVIPSYINERIYCKIIDDISNYMNNKRFTIMESSENVVHLYYENESVNVLINNMILYHQMNKT